MLGPHHPEVDQQGDAVPVGGQSLDIPLDGPEEAHDRGRLLHSCPVGR